MPKYTLYKFRLLLCSLCKQKWKSFCEMGLGFCSRQSCPNQNSYIKKPSTMHALIDLLHQCYARILMLYLSKTFDLINRNRLLQKLASVSIPSMLMKWIVSSFTERKWTSECGQEDIRLESHPRRSATRHRAMACTLLPHNKWSRDKARLLQNVENKYLCYTGSNSQASNIRCSLSPSYHIARHFTQGKHWFRISVLIDATLNN